jgi:hypothetical protein
MIFSTSARDSLGTEVVSASKTTNHHRGSRLPDGDPNFPTMSNLDWEYRHKSTPAVINTTGVSYMEVIESRNRNYTVGGTTSPLGWIHYMPHRERLAEPQNEDVG